MRERSHQVVGRGHAQERDDGAEPVVGRTTLVEQQMAAERRSMFDDAQWEDVKDPALPEPASMRHLSAAAPAPAPAPPANAVPIAPPIDAPEAARTVYSDHHTKPHGRDFQRAKHDAQKHHPKQGKYNKRAVTSDKTAAQVAGRPGVVVSTNGHKDGTFMIKNATATRYVFINRGGKNIAQPFDIIEKAKLSDHNYRFGGHDKDSQGHTQRILLNPSQPRELVINDQPQLCVLSWIDGHTAAWIPVAQLEGNTSKILSAVRARAKRWNPDRVSNDPAKLASKSKHYIFRNDKVGQPTTSDDGDVLAAGKTSGDNINHYLGKDLKKEGFGEGGVPLGRNVKRSIVPICMNLPAGHTPPVAIDTAKAGESFFVMRDKAFHQEVPIFESGKRTSKVLMMWVFGHLGMYDAAGKLVPDPARRGWVPLRTLADAAHLKTTTVPAT